MRVIFAVFVAAIVAFAAPARADHSYYEEAPPLVWEYRDDGSYANPYEHPRPIEWYQSDRVTPPYDIYQVEMITPPHYFPEYDYWCPQPPPPPCCW